MLTIQDQTRICEMVSHETGVCLPEMEITEGDGLRIVWKGGQARITAQDRNALARACFLLACAIRDGKQSLELQQSRHMDSCGVMLDVSRNAVLTVEAVRRTLNKMAMLGMNLLMLYTEDTYEVEGEPYFGYLRGRYTKDELRQIDRYAESLDIELVPCIQTLGHLEQFLQWNSSASLRDQSDILLIDHPDTYALIDRMISGLRSCMRAKRIHIGMDEAHGVGLGRYYAQHGPTDRFELLNRHLKQVCEICRTYEFQPMMWSDMFFRLGSARNDYYDIESSIPDSVIRMIPDVDLVYWDYYHQDQAFYDHMLQEHARMGRTVFAGGIWTWSGFLPQVKRTWATMRPALRSCAEHHVHTVFATMWGDDGAETNVSLAFNQLPIFSEACWQGADVDDDEAGHLGELLTGIPAEVYTAFGEFYPGDADFRPGKGLIWCDLLYPLMNYERETFAAAADRYHSAGQVIENAPVMPETAYARSLFGIAETKAVMVGQLRERYRSGDREYLRTLAEEEIPQLLNAYAELRNCHRRLWERDNKRQGWEVLALRYGAVMGRLEDVQHTLRSYLEGRIDRIDELEEEPLKADRRLYQSFASFVTPSLNF